MVLNELTNLGSTVHTRKKAKYVNKKIFFDIKVVNIEVRKLEALKPTLYRLLKHNKVNQEPRKRYYLSTERYYNLLNCCDELGLKLETIFLAEQIFHFVTNKLASYNKVDLRMITSVVLAAKFEEIYPPSIRRTIRHFKSYTNKVSKSEIVESEWFILDLLEHKIESVTLLNGINFLLTFLSIRHEKLNFQDNEIENLTSMCYDKSKDVVFRPTFSWRSFTLFELSITIVSSCLSVQRETTALVMAKSILFELSSVYNMKLSINYTKLKQCLEVV